MVWLFNLVLCIWDFDICTDCHVSAHQPDIVVIDDEGHSAILIDVAIPADVNIISKESEKIAKYQDLCIKLQWLWCLRTVKVIPVVIGCLGTYSPNLLKFLKELPGKHLVAPLVKSAILGSAHLLRRVFSGTPRSRVRRSLAAELYWLICTCNQCMLCNS